MCGTNTQQTSHSDNEILEMITVVTSVPIFFLEPNQTDQFIKLFYIATVFSERQNVRHIAAVCSGTLSPLFADYFLFIRPLNLLDLKEALSILFPNK